MRKYKLIRKKKKDKLLCILMYMYFADNLVVVVVDELKRVLAFTPQIA